jgi:transcriptional regulator with XRE-family HTH domain
MVVGYRLKVLREEKQFQQVELGKRTGLHQCYISRVETGRTVPSLETLEKLARGLEIPLYRIFYDGADPKAHAVFIRGEKGKADWSADEDALLLADFRKIFARVRPKDRSLLLAIAGKMASRAERRKRIARAHPDSANVSAASA